MAPRKKSKKGVADATFKAPRDQPSVSTVGSGDISPERQKGQERKVGDATYRPQPDQTSFSSVETVRRSPGRPRKSQKTAASQAYRKPKVTLESTELRIQRGSPILPDGRNQETAAADSSDDGSLELSITDRLKNIRDFLIVEDPSTHPYFKDRLHEFETFMSDLASSKEMFNVNVYNDVKSMLRVHRERMLDRERDELMGPITFRVPSGSTTQSSNRDSVFSPNEARRRSDETDATSHHSGGWKEGARARFVNLYEDSDLLEFAPNLTAQMGKNTNRLEAKPDPVKRGKRPITEAFGDAGPASREGRRTPRAGERGRTSAEESLFTRKHPRGEHEDGVVGKPLHKQEERWTDEKGSQSRNNNVNLLGPIPNSGSGSLIPPEIADFQDENDGEPMASAKGERAKREADSEDEEFWPGDPVFMFGETNYLRALQSRQIEKDLAPEDEETQAAIDRKPLMGMFARFALPQVNQDVVEQKPKSKSYCTVS